MQTATISTIRPEHRDTWQKKVFFTFDIDWAHDDILEDTINLVEQAGVTATWFVTHDTPLLLRLRNNSKFELGIHPNFNFLLQGDPRNGANAEEVVGRLLEIVPEAKSVRSHSMAQSTVLLQLFQDKGLTHDSNHYIPEQTGIELMPWHLWNGMIKVPYFWEDDLACTYKLNTPVLDILSRGGIKVFNFHPIHIFLNTENMKRYECTKSLHGKPEELRRHRFEGKGVRYDLMQIMNQHGNTKNV